MIKIEYGYYDFTSNDAELKEYLNKALSFSPDCITVLPEYIRASKKIIDGKCSLASVIDYPFGISCLESRIASTKNAIKSGANIVCVVAPNHPLCNKKYDKLRKDINQHKDLCDRNDVKLRYILDYRTYNQYMVNKIAQIFLAHKIDAIYPSNNYSLDNIYDNMIASMSILKKVPIDIIINGNAWTDKHAACIVENPKIHTYHTNNIFFMEKLVYNLLNHQSS